jgi:hypothetical protein
VVITTFGGPSDAANARAATRKWKLVPRRQPPALDAVAFASSNGNVVQTDDRAMCASKAPTAVIDVSPLVAEHRSASPVGWSDGKLVTVM